jgi:HrpA-like RNA helicase
MVTLLAKNKIKEKPHYSVYEKDFIKKNKAIDFILYWIEHRLQSKVLLIQAKTGTGKSVTLPAELFISLEKPIIVTQPKVLTAVSIANDIAKFYKTFTLGKDIGYITQNFKMAPRDHKSVKIVTTGILLNMFQTDIIETLEKTIIIIDECHSNSIDFYMLFYHIKSIKDNPRSPVFIFTSATINIPLFSEYFDILEKDIIEIGGVNYPIYEYTLEYPLQNAIPDIFSIITNIHEDKKQTLLTSTTLTKPDFEDILVFVSSSRVAQKLILEVNQYNNNNKKNGLVPILIMRYTYDENSIDYLHLTQPIHDVQLPDENINCTRKVIFTTNFAETGITIPNVGYVLDTGDHIYSHFDIDTFTTTIKKADVARDSLTQRMGRVGRRGTGVYIGCYVEKKRLPISTSELLTSDMAPHLLNIIIKKADPKWDNTLINFNPREENIHNIKNDINFINPIPQDHIDIYFEYLRIMGYIDEKNVPTISALIATTLRLVSLNCLKMILTCYAEDKSQMYYIIFLAAFINLKTEKGDMLSVLDLIPDLNYCLDNNTLMSWCDEHNMSVKQISSILSLKDNIHQTLLELGLSYPFIEDAEINLKCIKKSIYYGFMFNVMVNKKSLKSGRRVTLPKEYREFTYLVTPNLSMNDDLTLTPENICFLDYDVAVDEHFYT